MKYSLDTTFHLSAKHQEFDESSEYFDGYFRKGNLLLKIKPNLQYVKSNSFKMIKFMQLFTGILKMI